MNTAIAFYIGFGVGAIVTATMCYVITKHQLNKLVERIGFRLHNQHSQERCPFCGKKQYVITKNGIDARKAKVKDLP